MKFIPALVLLSCLAADPVWQTTNAREATWAHPEWVSLYSRGLIGARELHAHQKYRWWVTGAFYGPDAQGNTRTSFVQANASNVVIRVQVIRPWKFERPWLHVEYDWVASEHLLSFSAQDIRDLCGYPVDGAPSKIWGHVVAELMQRGALGEPPATRWRLQVPETLGALAIWAGVTLALMGIAYITGRFCQYRKERRTHG